MGRPSCGLGHACMAHARRVQADHAARRIGIRWRWAVVFLPTLLACGGDFSHLGARIEAWLGALERSFQGLQLWCRAWWLWW